MKSTIYCRLYYARSEILLSLVDKINNKNNTVSALKSKLKVMNSTYLIRSIAWMNEFDIIEIQIS